MKKIHIHTDCWYFGGCENIVAALLDEKELKKTYSFTFSYRYSKDYEKGLRKRVSTKDIKNFPLRFWPNNCHISNIEKLLEFIFKPFLVLLDIIILYRVFKKLEPHILFINNGGYPGARSPRSAVLAGKLVGIETILFYVNNSPVPYNSLARILEFPFDCLVKKNVTYFITASKFAGDRLSEVLKVKRSRVLHLFNTFLKKPVTKPRDEIRKTLGVSKEDILIGSVGLLEERKGHNYVIGAAGLLKNRYGCNNFKLVIVGFGPEKTKLEKLIKDYDISDSVRIIPNQDNIFDYYNGFDIFVLSPVAYDDFPFTVREAMYMGLPVVSAKFAGIPEIVEHEKNGILVEGKNITHLARSLKKLVEDNDTREKFGEESKKIYEDKLSHGTILGLYKDLFEKL